VAIKLADAIVFLRGDDSGLDADLGKAEKKTKGWAGRLGGAVSTLAGGAIVAGATAAAGAVVAVGAAALNVSKDTRNAASDMAASLAIPREEAEEFAKVAKRVYSHNFADNVGDAADAVTVLAKRMKLTADDPALETLTEKALAFRDSFDEEVNDSVDAAAALMENLGLSGDEAFDFITAGMQRGLNSSGDFLDTIREYSNQFGDAGFSADKMFSILESGSQSGVLGTDKMGDAIKEMLLRLNAGGDDVSAAFEAIGMDFNNIVGHIRSGDEAWSDYFPNIIEGLNSIEDPIARSQAQVAIFGTQAEDMGVSFTEGLSASQTSMEDLAGSADMLNEKYNSFGDFFSGLWRRTAVAVSPLTDKLLDLGNKALPHIENAFTWFENKGIPAIEKFGGMIGQVVAFVMGVFENLRASVGQTENQFGFLKTWFDTNLPLMRQTIETVLRWIQDFWTAHGETIMTVVRNTFSTVQTIVDTVLRTILDLITLAMQIITGDWEGAGQTLIGIVTRLWETIKTVFSNQLNSIWTILRDFGSTMANAGRALIESLWQGIRDRFNGLLDGVRQRLQQLRNLLPGSEPKDPRSPLRRLGLAGEAVVENVQVGIDKAQWRIDGAAAGVLGSLQAAGAGALGPVTVHQVFNGRVEAAEAERATETGVLHALRQAGLA